MFCCLALWGFVWGLDLYPWLPIKLAVQTQMSLWWESICKEHKCKFKGFRSISLLLWNFFSLTDNLWQDVWSVKSMPIKNRKKTKALMIMGRSVNFFPPLVDEKRYKNGANQLSKITRIKIKCPVFHYLFKIFVICSQPSSGVLEHIDPWVHPERIYTHFRRKYNKYNLLDKGYDEKSQ